MKNFHTHTYLCKHAVSIPIEYAKVACENNFTALGFSDHCPYPDNTWVEMHMELDEQDLYYNMVMDAKKASNIPIYFGYECEWDKSFYSWYHDKLIYENGAEYLIFGPHWVKDGSEFIYVTEFKTKATFIKYIDLTLEGMDSGLYSYVAHPDLFLEGITDITDFHLDLCKKIIQASIDLKIPLEINGNGCQKDKIARNGKLEYRYPVKEFWLLAKEMGAYIIIASDAHDPNVLVSNMEFADKFARDLGIEYDANYEPNFFVHK